MKVQLENKLMSSLLLYVDHYVLKKGEAFTNTTSQLYSIGNEYSGYHSYATPYKQIVADTSIAGINVLSGVSYDGTFYGTGTSAPGLHSVNHYNGQFYLSQNVDDSLLSATYSVKDFNVNLTAKPESELLFETKFNLKPRANQTVTGLADNQQTYPAIFLKNLGGTNQPFAFGGQENSVYNIRNIILSDSAFNLDAVVQILRDRGRDHVPIIEQSELPFNALGGAVSGYNYEDLIKNKAGDSLAYISNVSVSKDLGGNLVNNINPNVYSAFVNYEIEVIRYPRA
jgi:hypothetical protein